MPMPRNWSRKRRRKSARMVALSAPVVLSLSSHIFPPMSVGCLVVWSRAQSRRRADARRATPSARGSRCPHTAARDMDGRPAQSTCCLARAHARLTSAADADVAPGVQARTRPTGDSVHGNGRSRRGRHRRSHLAAGIRPVSLLGTGLGPAKRVRTGALGAVAGMNRAKRGYVVRGGDARASARLSLLILPPTCSLPWFSSVPAPIREARLDRRSRAGRCRPGPAPAPSRAATAAARCCTATATSSGELDPAACDSLVRVGDAGS